MIAFVCLFLPPALMVALWNRIKQKNPVFYRDVIQYIGATVLINFLCIGICVLFFGSNETLTEKLNTYNNFALKYLFLSTGLAISLPGIVAMCQTKNRISVEIIPPKISLDFERIAVICYAVILFLLHATRIFDNNFWGDECYSIALSRMTFEEMLQATANDVHPPLYYILLQMVCLFTGNNYIGYHLTSLIPYTLVLCFALTTIWKKYGSVSSVVLITFASLLSNSIVYNVEVRMYSWGALFILLSYWSLLNILSENRNCHYRYFVFFSLGAAYTHYYCLITVAFFYVALLVLSVIDRKKYLKKVIFACIITVVAYIPWLIVLIKTMMVVSDGFWLHEYPTLMESLLFVFESKYQNILLISFAVITVLYLMKELQFFTINKSETGSLVIRLKFANLELTPEVLWVITGVLSVLGTIVAGIAVSAMIRPLYLERYLYPAAVIPWLIFGVSISKLRGKRFLCLLLVMVVLAAGIPQYQETVKSEKSQSEQLETTLKKTVGFITEEDMILTNHSHIAWTISDYYYPNIMCRQIGEDLQYEWESGNVYWLFLNVMSEESIIQNLENQDVVYEKIITDGILGKNLVDVYKVSS